VTTRFVLRLRAVAVNRLLKKGQARRGKPFFARFSAVGSEPVPIFNTLARSRGQDR
jgi:hypothetical protein